MIAKWEGMPPADNRPGLVWWHSDRTYEYGLPSGTLFEAPPNATEEQLAQAAAAKWAEIDAAKPKT